ncbi:hypothetical protein PaeCFBP13512_03295 [Paenibacillus sp. CFBP13512]|nr:hypothetical protein PaeCFBP13512_03295 [Paenibacillus sp. CFBP13512]
MKIHLHLAVGDEDRYRNRMVLVVTGEMESLDETASSLDSISKTSAALFQNPFYFFRPVLDGTFPLV